MISSRSLEASLIKGGTDCGSIYFVYGLGGYALETWTSKPSKGRNPCLWSRDLLFNHLTKVGLKGRISTFGYSTGASKPNGASATMEGAANDLFNLIMKTKEVRISFHFVSSLNRESSKIFKDELKPIYFVCHSLGGLVVCQASCMQPTGCH